MTDLLLDQRKTRFEKCLANLKEAMLPPDYRCVNAYQQLCEFNKSLVESKPGILDVARGDASYLQTMKLIKTAKAAGEKDYSSAY